jgi:uncharacterized membrane protein
MLAGVAVLALACIGAVVWLWPQGSVDAGEPPNDIIAGVVISVDERQEAVDPNFGVSGRFLVIGVEFTDGVSSGRQVSIEVPVEGFPDVSIGDRVNVEAVLTPDGFEYYITDFVRTPALLLLTLLFIAAVLAISRWHGLRSLIGLGASLAIVIWFIVPAILDGRPPALVALVGSVAIMIITLYFTHGVRPMTTAAVLGTTGALALTVTIGTFFISSAKITGFASDDAVFARFAVDGALDLQGLVLAGLIIAALGVLDDVTIAQSSTVFALHHTDPTLTFRALFARAMVVGRDHIASVVNTLFLAYAGASLALLVLFSTGGVPVGELINSEILATEIVKTIVGSLGLILAVPFTTALAATVVRAQPREARR